MNTRLRLDLVSPNLAQSFRNAGERRRRHAALAACSAAVSMVGLRDGGIDDALEILRGGEGDWEAVKQNLIILSARFDEKYFELSGETDEVGPNALLFFRKARAASALAFALSRDSEQLHEAIYEAIAASGERVELIELADAALRTG